MKTQTKPSSLELEQSESSNIPIYDNMRNGKAICSAHPLLIRMLTRIEGKLDTLTKEVNNLETEDKIKKKNTENWEKWKNRIYGAGFTVGGLIIIKLIEFFTPL